MFIAMNNFNVTPGREHDFEQQWQSRRSYLQDVPGFVQFVLLRADAPGEYISHTTWTDRAAFESWTQSEAFRAAHRQGSVAGILQGPPHAKLYDAVIVEQHTTDPIAQR